MKRFLSVDIAKGISIIAIVLGHINFQYPAGQLVNTKDLFIVSILLPLHPESRKSKLVNGC